MERVGGQGLFAESPRVVQADTGGAPKITPQLPG
jgi:hypothetical protein